MKNIFNEIPGHLSEELVEAIGGNKNVRIERIISEGNASDDGFWYEQQESEFILLIQGEAELEFVDRHVHLKAGDYLNIEAGEKHRVSWTASDVKTIWLAVFYPPE